MTRLHPSKAVVAPIVALMALACASPPAPAPTVVSPSRVAAAEQNGTLEELYRNTTNQLTAPDLTQEQRFQLEQLQREAGGKLAALVVEDVRRELAEVPRVFDTIPLSALEAQKPKIEPIRAWSISQYAAISDQLISETLRTNAAIAERQAMVMAAAPDNVAGKLQLLEELGALSGIGSVAASGYAEQRREIVTNLSRDATTAIEEENYDDAKRILEIVKEVDPSNESTTDKLATVDSKVFEQQFYEALEVGNPDKGYALLRDLSAGENFDLMRPKLASSADVMAAYYVSLGAEATKAKDVPAAHRRFMEARDIREILSSETAKRPAEEAAFLRLLDYHYAAAKKKEQMGLAWGYLNVVKSMQAENPTLRRNLRETREEVLQRAIKRLSVSPFEDPQNATAEFGDAIASGVVQHLFETIPNDIRIIEREQLSDIMREKTIGGAENALAAADYLVQGTILEAKVDSVEKTGKQTRRVTTEQAVQPNPDYTAWLSMKSKDRKDIQQPPRTILVERREDVSNEVTVHRKVGIMSVSFRVIDASTAKVVFADSVREKAQHEDTSSEGVELGTFKIEFKIANLPSDIEILAGLADNVSSQIGDELAKVLAEPEKTYQSNAERFDREANYEAAAQQYAYAIVLEERKDRDVEDLLAGLRAASIASSAR
jgi:hypothetical protein